MLDLEKNYSPLEWFGKIISVIFHPVFMPFIGLYLILNKTHIVNGIDADASLNQFYAMFAMLTIGFPLMMTFLMKSSQIIDTIELKTGRERRVIYICQIIIYSAMLVMFNIKAANFPLLIFVLISSVLVSLIIAFILSFRIIISAHLIGIFGLIGMLAALPFTTMDTNPDIIIALFILGGLVGTARLITKSHTNLELILGASIGFFVSFFSFVYELVIY